MEERLLLVGAKATHVIRVYLGEWALMVEKCFHGSLSPLVTFYVLAKTSVKKNNWDWSCDLLRFYLYEAKYVDFVDFLGSWVVRNLSRRQFQSLGRQDLMEKEMVTHSSILLPGKSCGQRSLVSYIVHGVTKESDSINEQQQFLMCRNRFWKVEGMTNLHQKTVSSLSCRLGNRLSGSLPPAVKWGSTEIIVAW